MYEIYYEDDSLMSDLSETICAPDEPSIPSVIRELADANNDYCPIRTILIKNVVRIMERHSPI